MLSRRATYPRCLHVIFNPRSYSLPPRHVDEVNIRDLAFAEYRANRVEWIPSNILHAVTRTQRVRMFHLCIASPRTFSYQRRTRSTPTRMSGAQSIYVLVPSCHFPLEGSGQKAVRVFSRTMSLACTGISRPFSLRKTSWL